MKVSRRIVAIVFAATAALTALTALATLADGPGPPPTKTGISGRITEGSEKDSILEPGKLSEADAPEPTRAEMFKQIATILKREGTTKDDVLTITIPRDDLSVTVDGQDVPTAAGIESQFRFYQCPCGGKISVIGSFLVADYEANDVVDALREGHLVVASVGPFLAYENPRLTMVRFQGEAKAEEMGTTLKKTLEWTGEQRGKPRKVAD